MAKANAGLQRRYRAIAGRMVPGAIGIVEIGAQTYWVARSVLPGNGKRLLRLWTDKELERYVRRCVRARDRLAEQWGFRPEAFALPALY